MLTANEIYHEYTKCLLSPIYAIETYLETFDKTQEGFVPFHLYPRQKEIINAYEKNRFNLVTKPRQAGVSTTTAAYLAVKAAFADEDNPESILIIANKQELAFEFLAKIKDFVNQLPRWVWGAEYYGNPKNEEKTIFIRDSKKEIKLPNGTRVKAVATSKDALRGFTPTYLVMDEAAYIDNGAEVFGAALTALGCLTKDTLILTKDGLVELNDIVKEQDKLGFTTLENPHIVCNKHGELTQATQTFVSEYGETVKIKTKIGIELEGSWKHPILINRNNDEIWVKMNELCVGDRPIINYNQNYFGSNSKFNSNHIKYNSNNKNISIPLHLSDNLNFAYLLGLFVAKGNFHKGGISITNKNKQIIDFLINDEAKLGYCFKQIDNRHLKLNSQELVYWFESFGLKNHNAIDKEIPLSLLTMPKNVIVSFLQGMFDGDGSSTKKEIKYSSISHKLIKRLQIILLNFGIISHIKKETIKNSKSSIVKNKNNTCIIYSLKIYSNYAIKFYNEIGFRLEYKQNNKVYLEDKINNSRFVNVSKNKINELLKEFNIPKYKVRFLNRFFNSKYERITYHSLYKLRNTVGNHPIILELLNKIKYNEKYYTDEIVEISKSYGNTYDLHVPITNSFISNGIISHNTGGHAMLISTPKGMDALYYKTYDQAKQKKNNFNIIEMKWYEDLRYNKDLKWIKDDITEIEYEFTFQSYEKRISDGWKPTSPWYEEMCRSMNNDAKMIAQELDVSFIGSGGNVINEEYIDYQEKNNVKDPIYTSGIENEIWIWAEPKEGHQYILSVDVSRGDGADTSTIEIIDFTEMEQVMEYQGKIQPDLLAQIVEEYGELYKAYTIVDITGGMGVSTVLKLLEFGYKRLHYDELNGKILSLKQRELSNFNKENRIPGFQATSVRLPMISHLEYCIRTNAIKIRSSRSISEMKTFIYKNGRPDHMDGYHDDCLMALGMGLWVLEHSFKKLEKLEKQNKAILSSWIAGAPPSTNTNKTPENKIKQLPISKSFMTNDSFNKSINDYTWLFGPIK